MAFLDPSAFVGTYPAVNLRFARHPTTIADLTRLPAVTRLHEAVPRPRFRSPTDSLIS